MMVRLVLSVLLVGSGGCAKDARFVQHRVRTSYDCSLTLVQDRRTALCLAVFRCMGGTPSMVQVPDKTCEP